MAAKPLHGKEASREKRPEKSDEKSEPKKGRCTKLKMRPEKSDEKSEQKKGQLCTPALQTKKVLPSPKLSAKVVLHCSESNVLLTLVDNIRLFETGDILSPQ